MAGFSGSAVFAGASAPELVRGFPDVGLAAGPRESSAPIPMPQKSRSSSASPAGGESTDGYTHVGTPNVVGVFSPQTALNHLCSESIREAHGTPLFKPSSEKRSEALQLIGQGTSGFVLEGSDETVVKYVPLSKDPELKIQVINQMNDEAVAFKRAYPESASDVSLSTGNATEWDRDASAGLDIDFYRPWCKFLEASKAGNWAEWEGLENPTFVRLVLPRFPGGSLDKAHADIFQITLGESGKKRWRTPDEVAGFDVLIPGAYLIARGLLAGVYQIHRAGVIHGDLKPANVVFSADSQVKIVDFGSAKAPEMTVGESCWIPPTLVFAKPGVRKIKAADVFVERLWDWSLDYYSSAILIASFVFHPSLIQLGFKRTPEWYVGREIQLKESLNQLWGQLENPASGLTPRVIQQGKFLIHAISQLLCLIKTPEDLREFLAQGLDDFNHKPLYLRAVGFYIESIPEIGRMERTESNLYDQYKKHQETKKAGATGAGTGAGSESLPDDLAQPLLGSVAASSFEDPVARALFQALCPIKTSCFCFYRADPTGYQLSTDISDFERRCLEGFVQAAPSVSRSSSVGASKTATLIFDGYVALADESFQGRARGRAGSAAGRSEGGFSLPGVHPAGESKEPGN